jgi:hypothetical protein
MKLVLIGLLLFGCSTELLKKEKSKKEIEKRQIETLIKVRPMLVSDNFEFMKCDKLKTVLIDDDSFSEPEIEFWKRMGHLSLREKALQLEGNIISLKHSVFGKINKFEAVVFSCKETNDATEVGEVGMCKPSEQRMFKISYANERARDVGEELLRQKVRYYAISNHYKTFSFTDAKYSYTRKEFSAKAAFYKCL